MQESISINVDIGGRRTASWMCELRLRWLGPFVLQPPASSDIAATVRNRGRSDISPAMSATPFRQVVRRWLRAGLAIACFASLGTRPVAAGVDAWTANGPFVTGSAGSARRLTVDPRNPAIIYAGASTSFDCGSSVFRSTNGGASWQTVLDEIPCVDAIAIDPADPRIVHVGVDSGVYTTADGGDTWRTVDLPQVTDTDSVICLAVDPTQPATLYSGTR